MSRTWKWMLGIVIVLAVAALVAAPLVLRRNMVLNTNPEARGLPQAGARQSWQNGQNATPGMGRGVNNWNRQPMMMNNYGFSPFGGLFMGFGMLLMLAVPLALLFGVIYFAVRLAIRASLPAFPPPAPPMPVKETHACPKCGFPLEGGWKHCPECGKRQ